MISDYGLEATRGRSPDRSPRVRFRGELVSPEGCDTLVSVGLSVDGPVAVWSSAGGERSLHTFDDQPGSAAIPRSRPDDEPTVVLAAYSRGASSPLTVRVPELQVAFPFVDRFPDGFFLVVGARSRWTDTGAEDNALIVDEEGRIARRGCLGDGLGHVQITDDGAIWTGYFDEGVFGNLGWGGRGGPTPLGVRGIVAWSAEFEKSWELDSPQGLVADCYALNATSAEVLACPYTRFPVVRIAGGQARVFPTEGLSGPRGIVADGDRVAVVGSSKDPSVLVVGDVAGGTFVEERRTHLWAPDGAPLPAARVHCRGPEAHFFVGASWLSFDLRELP